MASEVVTPEAARAERMNAGESPRSWSDFDIQRIVGSSFLHPVITEEARTVCQDAEVRVEHNRIRNVATAEAGEAIRVVPADDSRYAAVVIPVLLDGRLLLVGRYRYAIDRWSIEFPRFASHTHDTGWKHAAKTKLAKSIGLTPTKMTLLGSIRPDPALIAINVVIILAEGCTHDATGKADAQALVAGTVAVPPDEIHRLALRGEICCGVTLAALALYGAHSRRQ